MKHRLHLVLLNSLAWLCVTYLIQLICKLVRAKGHTGESLKSSLMRKAGDKQLGFRQLIQYWGQSFSSCLEKVIYCLHFYYCIYITPVLFRLLHQVTSHCWCQNTTFSWANNQGSNSSGRLFAGFCYTTLRICICNAQREPPVGWNVIDIFVKEHISMFCFSFQ